MGPGFHRNPIVRLTLCLRRDALPAPLIMT